MEAASAWSRRRHESRRARAETEWASADQPATDEPRRAPAKEMKRDNFWRWRRGSEEAGPANQRIQSQPPLLKPMAMARSTLGRSAARALWRAMASSVVVPCGGTLMTEARQPWRRSPLATSLMTRSDLATRGR
jgi:hypothetical protein